MVAGDGGDGQSWLGTAPHSGPAERHPADDFVGHRLLLRAKTWIAHLPRSPSSQHAQWRLGLAGPRTSRRTLDGDVCHLDRPNVVDDNANDDANDDGNDRLATRTTRPCLPAATSLDQTHDERISGYPAFGRQGQSGRPSVAELAVVVERHQRH